MITMGHPIISLGMLACIEIFIATFFKRFHTKYFQLTGPNENLLPAGLIPGIMKREQGLSEIWEKYMQH